MAEARGFPGALLMIKPGVIPMGTTAQYVARWPAGQEYLRPATTATSLGPPEPVHRLLSVR